MAQAKMVVSENRSAVYVLYMSNGSAGNCHLQQAIVEFINGTYATFSILGKVTPFCP